jgi:hypothetical protein
MSGNDNNIEAPETTYTIHADKLTQILEDFGLKHKDFEKFFTQMKKYEDKSVPISSRANRNVPRVKKFKQKIVKALFYIPSEKRYRYIKIQLSPSTIKKAGTGAYALEKIPKGAKGIYKGVARNENDVNMYYAWSVKKYSKKTGEVNDDDDTLYYVDAFDMETSNWTRFVNCGMKDKFNNFESEQIFDKFFYVAIRDIEKGEELFIDYGHEYRTENLKMKGVY